MSDTPAPTFFQSAFPTFHRVARNWGLRTNPEAIIDDTKLPEPLKDTAQQFVDQPGWSRKNAARLARMVISHFDKQLARGISAEALAAQFRESVPLPAVLELNEPSLLTLFSLPQPVAEFIGSVVRRTRLWRREQIDVAGELISHFQEGIATGVPGATLIESFGDVTTATRLIRRAKIRNRPLVWKMFRGAWQFVGVAVFAFLIVWFYFWLRYQFAKPNVTFDYIGNRDAKTKAIPESDRAWPIYAEAITKSLESPQFMFPALAADDDRLRPEWQGLADLVDVQRIDGRVGPTWVVSEEGVGAPLNVQNVQRMYRLKMDAYSKALDELHRSVHWAALVQLADMNHEAIELALKASTKPQLGFIYRDPANATWLNSKNVGSYQYLEASTNALLTNVLLPHIQALSSFHRLLMIECGRAIESKDRARALQILSAFLRISSQIYHSDEFAAEKLIAIAFSNRCSFLVRKMMKEQPQLLTNDDLRDLAHRIAAHRLDLGFHISSNSQTFSNDLLQRLYTDDGHGDGYLTSAGTLLLVEQAGMNQGTIPIRGREWNGPFPLAVPLLLSMSVSRAELKQVLDHCAVLDDQEVNTPLWETDLDQIPASVGYLREITSTTTGRLKYGVLLNAYPFRALADSQFSSIAPSSLVLSADSAKMLSDAAQVAIALEAYHRRHNVWPDQLEKLCPDLLPTVPLDRFDGKPFKYKLVENVPIVYSVGRNRMDDGGLSIAGDSDGFDANTGDWRLWPVAVGGQ